MDSESAAWFQLTLLLIVAVATYFLMAKVKQPLLIGEILAGIIISILFSTFFGSNFVPQELVSMIATIGSIVLLFMIGLECDLRAIYTERNLLIAFGGVVLPWILGFLVFSYMVPTSSTMEAIFVGVILVATSVAVTADILVETGTISKPVGKAILGAAVIDDILGMIVLALTKGAIGGDQMWAIPISIVSALAFLGLGIFLGVKYLCPIIKWAEDKGKKNGIRHIGFTLGFAIALLYAFIADLIGISAIVGAFVAGTVFASLPFKSEFEVGNEYLESIFVPIFFITAGLMFSLNGLIAVLPVAIALVAVAIIGKVVGCGIPARLSGLSNKEAIAVGWGMVPRMEVAMVIAIYGLENGIIGDDIYSMAVFIGLATALITPTMLRLALKDQSRDKRKQKMRGVSKKAE
jgi:Kef-type K+ transport system membrane component KefB